MVGLVICQLLLTKVRSRPRSLSLWSQAKQISFFCASVSVSKSAFTAVSGGLGFVGAAGAAFATAGSSTAPAAAAKKCRRLTPSQSEQRRSFMANPRKGEHPQSNRVHGESDEKKSKRWNADRAD